MKTILITGANGGIGLAIVELFLDNKFQVIAHYHKNRNHLDSIGHPNLTLLKADLSNQDESATLIKDAFKISDTIDILINNAGVYSPTDSFEEQTITLLEMALAVNLKAPFILSKEYLAKMKNHQYGNIINISSIGIKYGGSPIAASYTITKAALEQMTLVISKEAAKYNILVNALRVGVVRTGFHQKKDLIKRQELIPLKRLAEPKEIAEYVFFLASEKNKYMSGSIMTVAGGE